MFEELVGFDKILVTGPQRSGTRIVAVMIADTLGYKFYGEQEIKVHGTDMLRQLVDTEHEFAIQCPGICHCIERFSAPDVAIVLVRRRIEDIIASQQRIDWKWEFQELAKYGLQEGIIAEVKYRRWEKQKSKIENAFEVEYEELKGHPLWVPKEKREDFTPRQTEVE